MPTHAEAVDLLLRLTGHHDKVKMAEQSASDPVAQLNRTDATTAPYNTSPGPPAPIVPVCDEVHFCKRILYMEMGGSGIRTWDLAILLPTSLFLIFLMIRFPKARLKLRASTSPIFSTFYGLVVLSSVIGVIRSVVSMCVTASVPAGDYTDKVLWVAVRFFLLFTEMSVVIFALAFGHLDSRTSIKWVLICTSLISLVYSSTQAGLEITQPDHKFHVPDTNYDVFGHGGTLFWSISSGLFSLVYVVIFILPWTRLRERIALPAKRAFYRYILFLGILNFCQSIGSALWFTDQVAGLCMVDVTTYTYFTTLSPLVYTTFLSEFLGAPASLLFSYKPQVDDTEDIQGIGGDSGECIRRGLPHQLSCSSIRTDSDFIYQVQ